ncbi:hypothetical protein [Mycobacterium sp. AT1]|uniref:hypothetical protein n=1 Tax=Mycobacterium sp. AT1 TaxID=1961706 RepID=UPI001301DC44|nr:hypothetical protein [Mycobacterium sp. AT1]
MPPCSSTATSGKEFKGRSQRAGLSQCQYNADVIRERLGLATRVDRTEALPLAM